MPDLNAMIKTETGLDVSVDQREIIDIVLGRKLSSTTFDFNMLHDIWSAFDRRVAAHEAGLSAAGPTEDAIQRLVAEAYAMLEVPWRNTDERHREHAVARVE